MKQKTSVHIVGEAKYKIEFLVRIIGLAGLMTLVVACSGNNAKGEVTAEELLGTWKVVDGRGVIQFDEDGGYRWASTVEGLEFLVVEQGH